MKQAAQPQHSVLVYGYAEIATPQFINRYTICMVHFVSGKRDARAQTSMFSDNPIA